MKEFKTIHEQIEILKSRGLLIENNQETEIFLLKNNYYRVSGYSLTLRNKDVFYPGSTFQNIIDIYEFDRELRHILMRYLDIIEITFKSIYAYESARLIGPLGYLDKNHFTDEKVYDVTIKKINEQKKKRMNHEAYLKHYQDIKEQLPIWAAVDLFSFSNISILYSISDRELQDSVASYYKFMTNHPGDLLKSSMKSMTIIRNLCAHESRIYNRLFEQKPYLSKESKKLLRVINQVPDNSHIYSFILLMEQLLDSNEFSRMRDEMVELFERYPSVGLECCGFRKDWKEKLLKEVRKMPYLKNERTSWDEYFMAMAELTATRSTCLRRHVGAVIVKDKHVIATGYNGAPRGLDHCAELGGCLREKLGIPSGERQELCRAVHAEQNAIIQAATLGQSVEGASIYITHQPCVTCAKMIINAGIDKVIVKEGYPDKMALEMLEEAGKRVIMLKQPTKENK